MKRFELRFYNDERGNYLTGGEADSVLEARKLRHVSGELIYDRLTGTICADPGWLWEHEKRGGYAYDKLGKRWADGRWR